MREEGSSKKRSSKLKAMELLSYKVRTEKELRGRLLKDGYTEAETEEAIRYVSSYGYINDREYALQYVELRAYKKGKTALRAELRNKGIADELIEEALLSIDDDEEERVYGLLLKRGGEPHSLDEKEYRRLFAYCARRGFSSSAVNSAMRRFDIEE